MIKTISYVRLAGNEQEFEALTRFFALLGLDAPEPRPGVRGADLCYRTPQQASRLPGVEIFPAPIWFVKWPTPTALTKS